MRTRSFIFSIGMAAMLFAACSNDDDVVTGAAGGNGTDQGVVEGEPTYATFAFATTGVANTRATEAPGGNGDNLLGDVTVLIFNNQTKVLENKLTATVVGDTAKVTSLVTSGKKRIFAFSNLELNSGKAALDAMKIKETTIDDMLALKALMGTDMGQTSTHVPMSVPDDGKVTEVKNGIEEANAPGQNSYPFEMLRMIARTELGLKAGVSNVKLKGFAINNVAKNTYIVQHATGGVKSPLYERQWEGATEPITADDFMTKETEYTNKPGTFYYLTENTSPSFLKGSATHLIVNAVYIPKEGVITKAEYQVGSQILKYTYDLTPDSATCETYCYVTASPSTIIPVGRYFQTKELLDKAISDYNTGIKDDNTKTPIDPVAVKYVVYTEGSYYRINIGEGVGANTTFGVERNKSYVVKISSVTGPGFNRPDGNEGAEGKPTDPIDQKTYVQVVITAADWTKADQEVDIN